MPLVFLIGGSISFATDRHNQRGLYYEDERARYKSNHPAPCIRKPEKLLVKEFILLNQCKGALRSALKTMPPDFTKFLLTQLTEESGKESLSQKISTYQDDRDKVIYFLCEKIHSMINERVKKIIQLNNFYTLKAEGGVMV